MTLTMTAIISDDRDNLPLSFHLVLHDEVQDLTPIGENPIANLISWSSMNLVDVVDLAHGCSLFNESGARCAPRLCESLTS